MNYSYFTNEYTLTKEMCAETELSRIDVGIAYVLTVAAAMMLAFFRPFLKLIPEIPDLLYAYFSSPSPDTILELSGVNAIYPFASISITAAAILMIKSFPQLVGDKRYDEQLKFLPSFGIILRLSIPELMILARFIRQQFLMSPLLDDLSLMKDGNLITELAGGETVADINGSLISHYIVKFTVNLRLRHRVQGRSGLIQNDKGRIPVESPCNCNLLGFASGNLYPILHEILIKHGVQTFRHGRKPLSKARIHQSFFYFFFIIFFGSCHIGPKRLGEQLKVLKNYGKHIHIIPIVIFADINPI